MPKDDKSEKNFEEIELQGFEVELSGFDDIELKRFDVDLEYHPFMFVSNEDLQILVNDLIELGYITSTNTTAIVKELRNKWKKG